MEHQEEVVMHILRNPPVLHRFRLPRPTSRLHINYTCYLRENKVITALVRHSIVILSFHQCWFIIWAYLAGKMVGREIQQQWLMLSYYQRQRNQKSKVREGSLLMASKSSQPISPSQAQFHASKLADRQKFKEESLERAGGFKSGFKIATTDESSNNQESESRESRQCLPNQQLNEEYFQPLSFRQKKLKAVTRRKEPQSRMIEDLSVKICEMSRLVNEQDREVKVMKSSMSEKELHRLLKMHSIEKLKLIESIARHQSKSKKKM